ncbi:hypothetical protein H5410_036037 [Solanum commersonii]|uniref:Uncharacterized protein n=1 Tax=Solanum commersonii TaxID=4109 RepID=A0A9J5Y3K6_SOLCO|nr:hypothetical protein H5410_036037 [Solanum commersonii]
MIANTIKAQYSGPPQSNHDFYEGLHETKVERDRGTSTNVRSEKSIYLEGVTSERLSLSRH